MTPEFIGIYHCKRSRIALSGLLFVMLMLSSCSRDRYREETGMVWHTTYHITYQSSENLSDSILRVLNEVGSSLNVFDPNSLASRVNSGDSIPVDADYERVYNMARKINGLTSGAFDPTLGPLITAWGFGKGHTATADTLRIDSLLNLTGITKTRIENGRLLKADPRIEFNFSAIAKGYGCDRVGEMFERNGISNYLVEIGGEIKCAGKSPSGSDWKISIDKPVISDSVVHQSQCVVAISGVGLATSGNYRNFRKEGKSFYGHTISARTGRPATTDILSASVIAPSAMEADAWATSMMAMGSGEAMKIIEKEQLAVMLILSDGSVVESDKFKTYLMK